MTQEQLKQELEAKLERIKSKIQDDLLEIERLKGGLAALQRLANTSPSVGPLIEPIPPSVTVTPQVQTVNYPTPDISYVEVTQPSGTHTTPYLAAKANRIRAKGKI